MIVIVLATGLALLGITGVFRYMVSTRAVRRRAANHPVDIFSDISAKKYSPMCNLLDEAEFEYLSAQPGFTCDLGRRFRAERRRLFRAYLRALQRDFDRLYTAANAVMLFSSEDRPDLAKALFQRRLAFSWALLRVEARLLLHRFGIGTVPVSDLIGTLTALQTQVRHLVAAAAVV